jgi:hypothetical protein
MNRARFTLSCKPSISSIFGHVFIQCNYGGDVAAIARRDQHNACADGVIGSSVATPAARPRHTPYYVYPDGELVDELSHNCPRVMQQRRLVPLTPSGASIVANVPSARTKP